MTSVKMDPQLSIKTARLIAFFPIFQQGFSVPIQKKQTILDFLCETNGLNPKVVYRQIQTLFLNGKAVDEMSGTLIKPGDTLALSAALPGLAGATMRSGGLLAGFRCAITHREGPAPSTLAKGLLTVKLFNQVIKALGPSFLKQGVLITVEQVRELLRGLAAEDWSDCSGLEINGQPVDPRDWSWPDWPQGRGVVRLQVLFE